MTETWQTGDTIRYNGLGAVFDVQITDQPMQALLPRMWAGTVVRAKGSHHFCGPIEPGLRASVINVPGSFSRKLDPTEALVSFDEEAPKPATEEELSEFLESIMGDFR